MYSLSKHYPHTLTEVFIFLLFILQLPLKLSIKMTSLPGRIGWSVTGDRTLDFARDPMDFTQRHIKAFKSRMFQGRSMNRPHAFVASNQGLKEVLEGMIQIFTMTMRNVRLLVIIKFSIKQVYKKVTKAEVLSISALLEKRREGLNA